MHVHDSFGFIEEDQPEFLMRVEKTEKIHKGFNIDWRDQWVEFHMNLLISAKSFCLSCQLKGIFQGSQL